MKRIFCLLLVGVGVVGVSHVANAAASVNTTNVVPNLRVLTNATTPSLTVTTTNWTLPMPSTGLLGGTVGGTVGTIKSWFQGSALTHAGTVTLDFDGSYTVSSLVITGDVTLAFSNLSTNRAYELYIKWSGSTNATLTVPATTVWQGTAPTYLWPTNKIFSLLFAVKRIDGTNTVLGYFAGQN